MDDYKYDVAFSFLGPDEPLVDELASRLAGRASVFIYSERQRELAGSDGLDLFRTVFGTEARVCVVLYRKGWGKTVWTGVEETAIKDRGISRGWDFLLVISLDETAPIWLPKTQLWLGWERFGLAAALAVIERKVTEGGGDLRELSAADHAERVGSELKRDAERESYLNSERGVKAAHEQLDGMFAHLESQLERINERAPQLGLHFQRHVRDRVVAVSSPGYTVTLGWTQQWANVLQHSYLFVRELAGPYSLGGFHRGTRVIREVHAAFTLDAAGNPAWVETNDPTRYFSSRALAERYLKLVIDHAGDEPQFHKPAQDDEETDWA